MSIPSDVLNTGHKIIFLKDYTPKIKIFFKLLVQGKSFSYVLHEKLKKYFKNSTISKNQFSIMWLYNNEVATEFPHVD